MGVLSSFVLGALGLASDAEMKATQNKVAAKIVARVAAAYSQNSFLRSPLTFADLSSSMRVASLVANLTSGFRIAHFFKEEKRESAKFIKNS